MFLKKMFEQEEKKVAHALRNLTEEEVELVSGGNGADINTYCQSGEMDHNGITLIRIVVDDTSVPMVNINASIPSTP